MKPFGLLFALIISREHIRGNRSRSMPIRNIMNTAKLTDWKTERLPIKRTTIALDRAYSPDDMERIRYGIVLQHMEDKWFIFGEDNTLYFHRSWTGVCVYVVRFSEETDGCRMVEADVNRDPEQYSETSDERDAEMIYYLVDLLLLNKEATYPSDEPSPELRAAKNWSDVGRSMLGQAGDD